MRNRFVSLLLVSALALSTFAACHSQEETISSVDTQATSSTANDVTIINPGSTVQVMTVDYTASDATTATDTASVPAVLAEKSQPSVTPEDAAEDSATAVEIALDGESIVAGGDGVMVDGSTATITAAGTYRISGSLEDGQIVVDTEDEEPVRLILNGVDIRNTTSAPINVVSAEEVVIVLADGTENYVSDGATYVYADPADDEPNAAIFSKDDLAITGSGSLTVEGNYNDGIASKDGLVIGGGTITVSAVDDGIRGKDYIVVEDGTITVDAGGDGLKSDEDEDAAKGYIAVESGVLNITAAGDAITAETDVLISGGEFTLTTGGGSNARIDEDTSAKGIKAAVSVTIDAGTFTIDSADDAIHSNDCLTINGGVFTLATGDDAVHADATLTINNGEFDITRSYEGIESALITINGGDISIVSSDDGINVATGNDGSGMGPGGRPGPGGAPGQQAFTYTGDNYLYIHGGVIVVNAAGDGIDVNGAIEMTGGLVVVNGPTENMNGALDYDGGFKISGGTLVAAGSAGMAQTPDSSSSQNSLLLNFASALPAGSIFHIQNADGETLLTFAPLKAYQSIAFSSPDLAQGDTVVMYYGGSASGTVLGGLYLDGTYTAGEEIGSVAITSTVTNVGGRSRF